MCFARRQKVGALSSGEAEWYAACSGAVEAPHHHACSDFSSFRGGIVGRLPVVLASGVAGHGEAGQRELRWVGGSMRRLERLRHFVALQKSPVCRMKCTLCPRGDVSRVCMSRTDVPETSLLEHDHPQPFVIQRNIVRCSFALPGIARQPAAMVRIRLLFELSKIDRVNITVMTARQIADPNTDYDHMGSAAWKLIFVNLSEGARIIRMIWLADLLCTWKEMRAVNRGFHRASHCIWWTCCRYFAERKVRRAVAVEKEVDDTVAQ